MPYSLGAGVASADECRGLTGDVMSKAGRWPLGRPWQHTPGERAPAHCCHGSFNFQFSRKREFKTFLNVYTLATNSELFKTLC